MKVPPNTFLLLDKLSDAINKVSENGALLANNHNTQESYNELMNHMLKILDKVLNEIE